MTDQNIYKSNFIKLGVFEHPIYQFLKAIHLTMSSFSASSTVPVTLVTPTLPELIAQVQRLIAGHPDLDIVGLFSGLIRNHPKLQPFLARALEWTECRFTTAEEEVNLSSEITLASVQYVRTILEIPEGPFTFTVLRPGSTQGKLSRYNSDGRLLEVTPLGDFGTGQADRIDPTILDGVIAAVRAAGDAGIVLSESAAYCVTAGQHLRLGMPDISACPEYDPKTKPGVLAFVNAISKHCGEVGYTQIVVSNRNDQKRAGMTFTMVDGYVATNPEGERIVIDCGGGTYKLYYQNGATATHLGDVSYDQKLVIDELHAAAAATA